ncbi:cytolytic toxin-alpha-like [Ictalurus furcatus]|uniref:cytolytic toxin-alpha-like n=1 Tax=Ictalurus furcatus TaxID=66913 RepID=UPI0023506DF4|nr:cytolytic toxin-alpha-like [Ictalurus furcatus]
MDSRYMEIAALGRPLYPGMLYDCRRDTFIPGVTLWDKKALRDDLDVHQQPKTHLKFAASDTLSDKANLLDISASLKASFLSGLVEVGGSAKYLRDSKSSARQCRVTMHYSQTTKFEQLTMKELGNITYPQVFDQKTATHVVTAVLYGAQAFMVFDYTTDVNENKQAVEGNLHAVVKKIPTISIEGEASLKMNEEEKQLSENISVTFYGDFELEENPTTYKESLEVYKKLPMLMKQRQNKGVPLNVWLYPLTLLDDKAAKLVREINVRLVDKTEHLLEELSEEERRCNDLIKNQMANDFPDLKDRLLRFQTLQKNYTRSFQKALSRLLPAIRGGTQEDKALGDILKIHYTSPFTASNMNKWLDDVTTEVNILSSYTSRLKDLTVVKSSCSLSSTLLDHDVDVAICLSFTSLKFEDSYLVAIQDFENLERFTTLDQTSKSDFSLQATQPWFTSPDVSASMRQNISLFTSFSKANKYEKRIKFIIASICDPSNPGTSIRLYQKGALTDPRFQPVSKPAPPVVQASDEKVLLKLSKSPTGETVRFRVEYRRMPPTDSEDDIDEWTVTDTSDAQTSFTLTGLKPADRYLVRYKAVSDVGVSEASDSVPFTFSEKPNVGVSEVTDSVPFSIDPKLSIKVGQSWNLFTSSLLNELRTKIMTSLGMSRWSLSTIKSEVTNVVNSPSTPYAAAIPGGLREGKALYFQGVVSATGQSIILDFVTPLVVAGDIAFHFRPCISDWICCDSRRNGMWEKQEKTSWCQISKGSSFDIFIVTKTEGYEVYINGQRSCLFKHRMPVENVTALNFHGDVIINTVGVVPNWNTSTFGKELNSGTSRTKLSDIQSDVPHPVCNPSKSYLESIPGGLRPGVALFFQGVVTSDCERFDINLQTGPNQLDDIALHFNPRLDSNSVVRNSRRDGIWEIEEVTPGGPFVKGGAFDIIMVVKPEGYEVMVNGLEYCTFNHRIPVDKVTTLGVRGDVFMNTVSIIEVDDLNLKVTIPANI